MEERATEKLFVYGSLKAGFPLHGIIEGHEFLGVFKTFPDYRLYDLGAFPALVPARRGRQVMGEVYLVDEEIVNYLDVVEGVNRGLYSRVQIDVHDQLGVVVPVWTYILLRDLGFGGREIVSGEWVDKGERQGILEV